MGACEPELKESALPEAAQTAKHQCITRCTCPGQAFMRLAFLKLTWSLTSLASKKRGL